MSTLPTLPAVLFDRLLNSLLGLGIFTMSLCFDRLMMMVITGCLALRVVLWVTAA
jgi:hypothetical protein